jgi:hypothetical protein
MRGMFRVTPPGSTMSHRLIDHGGAATFTKWITDWLNMAGVVGGSVGDGTFSGKVLDYNSGPLTIIAAITTSKGRVTSSQR